MVDCSCQSFKSVTNELKTFTNISNRVRNTERYEEGFVVIAYDLRYPE